MDSWRKSISGRRNSPGNRTGGGQGVFGELKYGKGGQAKIAQGIIELVHESEEGTSRKLSRDCAKPS